MKHFNNIRHFREFRGYSQQYVANRLKKSQAAFSKLENGYTHLSDDTIEQLTKILGVPKEKIYNDEKLIPGERIINGENFLATEKDLSEPLNNLTATLFNQLSENKKLLRAIELNQKKLQQQLDLLLSKLIAKNS